MHRFRFGVGAGKLGIDRKRIRQRLMQIKPGADGKLVEGRDAADVAMLSQGAQAVRAERASRGRFALASVIAKFGNHTNMARFNAFSV